MTAASAVVPAGAKACWCGMCRAATAATAFVPTGAKVCWCAMCGAATAATAFVPTGAKSVGVGETSRRKSVDVELVLQQLRSMEQERALRTLEKVCERIFEQVEKERSPSY